MNERIKEKIERFWFELDSRLNQDSRCNLSLGLTARLKLAYDDRGGLTGLYRGIVPGSIRSFLANGCAMIVMAYAQRKVTELGLRD